jgi:hypothetical protein
LQGFFVVGDFREVQRPKGVGVFTVVEIHAVEVVFLDVERDDAFLRERRKRRHIGKIELSQEKQFTAVGRCRPGRAFGQVRNATNLAFPWLGGFSRLCLDSDERQDGAVQLFL